jgi:hypothetical protein
LKPDEAELLAKVEAEEEELGADNDGDVATNKLDGEGDILELIVVIKDKLEPPADTPLAIELSAVIEGEHGTCAGSSVLVAVIDPVPEPQDIDLGIFCTAKSFCICEEGISGYPVPELKDMDLVNLRLE